MQAASMPLATTLPFSTAIALRLHGTTTGHRYTSTVSVHNRCLRRAVHVFRCSRRALDHHPAAHSARRYFPNRCSVRRNRAIAASTAARLTPHPAAAFLPHSPGP